MTTVCGAIIARDEESRIERCLASLRWADELLVVLDDRSVDATAERARGHGARVEVRAFVDYARQRNAALRSATSDWVLFVDADEIVPVELAHEVRDAVSTGRAVSGYWIPRKNMILGRWVRNAGWSPDHQLRLLRRTEASYQETRSVHELVELRGEAGYLRNALVHYNYATLGEFLAKQRIYAAMEASDRFRRGVRIAPRNYLLQPWREFWRRYVLLGGFKEGALGLLLSSLLAYYEFRTYSELRALWRQQAAAKKANPLPGDGGN